MIAEFKVFDIPINEYMQMTGERRLYYDTLIAKMQPNCKECKGLHDLTFDEVETMKLILANVDIEKFYILWQIHKKKKFNPDKIGILEFMNVWKHSLEILQKVAELEQQLKGGINVRLEVAGIDEFKKLGAQAVKIKLGKEFGMRPKEIGEWLWFEVFNIRLFNRIEDNITQRLLKQQTQ